jgi:tyrosyl-tRNA synthetase
MRGPTIVKLSHVLLKQLTGADAPAPTESEIQRSAAEQPPEALLQKIDQLSDQDVNELLSDLVDENELAQLLEEDAAHAKIQRATGD